MFTILDCAIISSHKRSMNILKVNFVESRLIVPSRQLPTMHSFPSTFLSLLLTEKGVAPVETIIVQDNAKQLYRPKRSQVRIRSSSALSLDGRPCRWSRTDSDLSLRAPSRAGLQHRPAHAARVRVASDISLFLSSKSRSSQHENFMPVRSCISDKRSGNAAWDKFDFTQQSKSSGTTALMKEELRTIKRHTS